MKHHYVFENEVVCVGVWQADCWLTVHSIIITKIDIMLARSGQLPDDQSDVGGKEEYQHDPQHQLRTEVSPAHLIGLFVGLVQLSLDLLVLH